VIFTEFSMERASGICTLTPKLTIVALAVWAYCPPKPSKWVLSRQQILQQYSGPLMCYMISLKLTRNSVTCLTVCMLSVKKLLN